VIVKMLALGLGLSVLIDASVIRLLVVPAAMFLLGKYNWWAPRWLDLPTRRRHPELHAEGNRAEAQLASAPDAEPKPAGVPSTFSTPENA
jgi:putative drug exporter of the RND superfamily